MRQIPNMRSGNEELTLMSMGKPCSCTQFIKSCIFLLQVVRESVSGTTSHVRAPKHAMKLKVHMIKSLSP